MKTNKTIEPLLQNGVENCHPTFETKDIFKYSSLKYLEKTLEEKTLKFSKLNDYNDPFEMAFHHNIILNCPDPDKITEKPKRAMPILNRNNKVGNLCEEIERESRSYLSNYAVTCFSMNPDEPLMWSHYSDEHKGICYCFDKKNIFSIENNVSQKDVVMEDEITYSNKIPELTYYKDFALTNIDSLKPQFIKILLTKSINWSYEREFRFFIETEETTINFNPKSLQAIIIGLRVKELEIEEIHKHVAKYNKKNDTEVKITYAYQSRNNYKMTIGIDKSNKIFAKI